jgi:tetratricopeptide (TPR) repeat protein
VNSARQRRLAIDQLGRGQVQDAIDTLAELLGEDADDAEAHALLSLCLVRRKRLHAAALEAASAIALDPESTLAHVASGVVAISRRKFPDAERHLLQAAELDPENDWVQRELAQLYRLWQKPAKALECARRALDLDPDEMENIVLSGRLDYDVGDYSSARERANAALGDNPEHVEALVLLGSAELALGNAKAARSHAIWALQLDPDDEGARGLLVAIKARSSWLLGLWWRFQTWVAAGSHTRAILLLVGLYVAYRSAVIVLEGQGADNRIVNGIRLVWLGFCLYTWVAPALFARALRKEMQEVSLREGF